MIQYPNVASSSRRNVRNVESRPSLSGRKYQFAASGSSLWPDSFAKWLACPSTPPHRGASSEAKRTAAQGSGRGQVSAPAAVHVRIVTGCSQSLADLDDALASGRWWLGGCHNAWPEVPGSIALDVSTYLVCLPSLRSRQDPHWTRGSSRIWTSGSLEFLSKHKEGLEVRRHVNSKLLTRIPKRTQPDRLVDQRIRRRK